MKQLFWILIVVFCCHLNHRVLAQCDIVGDTVFLCIHENLDLATTIPIIADTLYVDSLSVSFANTGLNENITVNSLASVEINLTNFEEGIVSVFFFSFADGVEICADTLSLVINSPAYIEMVTEELTYCDPESIVLEFNSNVPCWSSECVTLGLSPGMEYVFEDDHQVHLSVPEYEVLTTINGLIEVQDIPGCGSSENTLNFSLIIQPEPSWIGETEFTLCYGQSMELPFEISNSEIITEHPDFVFFQNEDDIILNSNLSNPDTLVYIPVIINGWGACSAVSLMDTITVDFSGLPQVSFENEMGYCASEEISFLYECLNCEITNWVSSTNTLVIYQDSIVMLESMLNTPNEILFVSTNICGDVQNAVEFEVSAIEEVGISLSGEFDLCAGDSLFLVSDNPDALWSNGVYSDSIWISTPGDYFAFIEIPYCPTVYSDTLILLNTANPNLEIIGLDSQYCDGDIAEIAVTGGANYLWSDGVSASVRVFTSDTLLSVLGSSDAGCYSSIPVAVQFNDLPIGSINGANIVCENSYWNFYECIGNFEGINWNVAGGEIQLEPSLGAIWVHWTNNELASIDAELELNSCQRSVSAEVEITESVAADTLNIQSAGVNLLFFNAPVELCTWGYTNYFTNVETTSCQNQSYCYYDNLDLQTNAYWVDVNGDDCITRSYFNSPSLSVGAESEYDQESLDLIVEAWPIPFHDILYFSANKSLIKIQVYDARGQVFAEISGDLSVLNTSSWPSGMYYLRFVEQMHSSYGCKALRIN